MPHVSNNNDPLLDRLIFAFDGVDYRVVTVNASGQLVAALATGSTIIATQATAANLKTLADLNADQNVQARGYGWYSSAWQKGPIPDGYSGNASNQVSNTSAAAGTNILTSSNVPAGEIWIVHAIAAYDNNSATTGIFLGCTTNGNAMSTASGGALAATIPAVWSGTIVLWPGDNVRAVFLGCTLNDDIFLTWNAVRIDIDQ